MAETTPNKKTKSRKFRIVAPIFWGIAVFLGLLAWFSTAWYIEVYGKMGFDAILFTLSTMQGVASGLVTEYLRSALLPAVAWTAAVMLLLWCRPRRRLRVELFRKIRFTLFPVHRAVASVLCLALSAGLLCGAAADSGLAEYVDLMTHGTRFFDEQYRDPDEITIGFPEKKRNLIYIFMESMENSFLSRDLGGTLDHNAIPELWALARDHVNFSYTRDVGGFVPMGGMNWTIAGMVAQTAGVPLKTPPGMDGNGYGKDGEFLPGITTLSDLLSDAGYRQAVMFGSDAEFGGRKAFFQSHGTDAIYDVFTAEQEGVIPEGYRVWWGFEDAKLFPYAREKILELAEGPEPFAFTLLTADTHHIDGYRCPDCRDDFAEQYENVYACSSRKVSEFVQWIQQQDFYENTTIVLVGDHCSMDAGYFERNADPGYVRTVYNCVIHPAREAPRPKERMYTSVDLFPTVLGAMGCEIPGDRLGLGTNLFSDRPTLAEEFGFSRMQEEISRYSHYYNRHFLEIPA